MNRLNPAERTAFIIIMAGLLLSVVIPMMFYLTSAFTSDAENMEFPRRLFPKFTVTVQVEYDAGRDAFEIFYDSGRGYGFESVLTSNNPSRLRSLFSQQYSVTKSGEELLKDFEITKTEGRRTFTYRKDMFYNIRTFFSIAPRARAGLINSLIAAGLTILISLSIGSLAGYAMARYTFLFKDQVSVLLLIVRMFPTVGISIPMAVMLIRMGMFDTLWGLAILYSIPNIALTAWVTGSIFSGIGRELEEASLVFGATGAKTFLNITLPMALPALAASSMYAFLAAWNDTIGALILTRQNQTLALVVYKVIGTNSAGIQYAAAGSLVLILPALVFTFIIRRYVGQMWGGVNI